MIVGLSKKKQSVQAFILLMPSLLIALTFIYLPSIYVLFLSFQDWDMISPQKISVGFLNYIRLLQPENGFWNSFGRTLYYTLIFIPGTLVISLGIALMIVKLKNFKGVFQSLFFIPSVTSISVIAIVWSYLFNPQIGFLNSFLSFLGVAQNQLPQWLNSIKMALPSIAVIGIWSNIGFMSLLFIAGLQNIPKTYYEAAEIDGAKSFTIFRHITLPLLSPVTYYVLFMLMINSFKMFDIISIMTKGRPQGSTNVLLYYVYQNAFQFFDAGLASAASWLIFVMLLALFLLQQKLGEKNVYYQ
ncbi:MAG: carbohydrate ABC transporter permease [Sphaerochaetaceae bacterium]